MREENSQKKTKSMNYKVAEEGDIDSKRNGAHRKSETLLIFTELKLCEINSTSNKSP